MVNWRNLLTKQTDPWLEKTLPTKWDNSRQYATEWDRLNHFKPPRYAWDQTEKETAK